MAIFPAVDCTDSFAARFEQASQDEGPTGVSPPARLGEALWDAAPIIHIAYKALCSELIPLLLA